MYRSPPYVIPPSSPPSTMPLPQSPQNGYYHHKSARVPFPKKTKKTTTPSTAKPTVGNQGEGHSKKTHIILRRNLPHKVIPHNGKLDHDIVPDLGYLVEELEGECQAHDAEKGGGGRTVGVGGDPLAISSLDLNPARRFKEGREKKNNVGSGPSEHPPSSLCFLFGGGPQSGPSCPTPIPSATPSIDCNLTHLFHPHPHLSAPKRAPHTGPEIHIVCNKFDREYSVSILTISSPSSYQFPQYSSEPCT